MNVESDEIAAEINRSVDGVLWGKSRIRSIKSSSIVQLEPELQGRIPRKINLRDKGLVLLEYRTSKPEVPESSAGGFSI